MCVTQTEGWKMPGPVETKGMQRTGGSLSGREVPISMCPRDGRALLTSQHAGLEREQQASFAPDLVQRGQHCISTADIDCEEGEYLEIQNTAVDKVSVALVSAPRHGKSDPAFRVVRAPHRGRLRPSTERSRQPQTAWETPPANPPDPSTITSSSTTDASHPRMSLP